MSRRRLLVALAIACGLLMLVAWQRHREAMMTACLERGGAWNGPASTCELKPFGPILKRALERS